MTRSPLDPNAAPGLLGGRYRLLELVGSGGMGEVWRAEHAGTGARVAVKLMRRSELGPRAETRFALEARHAASLSHPHVVRVFDYGVEQTSDASTSAQPYLVMEFLAGRSLATVLAEHGALPWRHVVHLTRQILKALWAAHAHARCIVHRDIKPENVMITEHEGEPMGFVKVLDFGIARTLDATENASLSIGGTPSTMAPEQWLGQPVSPATDLYALGCTVWEMLTGAPVFSADSLVALCSRHVHEPPPTWPGSPVGAVPASLVSWLHTLLHKAPGDRPASASHALAALDALEASDDPNAPDARAQPTPPSGAAAARAEPAPRRARRGELPEPIGSLVGRDAALDQLDARLDAGARLLTLHGAAGTGKTRLALELAHRRRAAGDAVVFCDLSAATTLASLCRTLGRALQVPLGERDPLEQLGWYLGAAAAASTSGRLLVVLDNCEQLAAVAATSAATWLERVEPLRLLVTSRQPLHAPDEQVVEVEPLTLPAEGGDGALAPAVRLFVDRARAARPRFSLDTTNLAAVVALVRELDGLPLAIELAAAHCARLEPDALLGALRRFRFEVLKSCDDQRTTRPDHHVTLHSALVGSWQLLTDWEQSALAQCSVFRGGFGVEAAEVIVDLAPWPDAGWVIDVLAALVDKSLVRRAARGCGDAPRFELLVSVREFAARTLDAGAAHAVSARHARYFARYGRREVMQRAHLDARVFEELHDELENLTAAARALDWPTHAARAACAAAGVVERVGPSALGAALLEPLLSVAALEPTLRGRVLYMLVELEGKRVDLARLGGHVEQALDIARRERDPWLEGHCLMQRGAIAYLRGDRRAALADLDATLATARDVGLRQLEATALRNLATMRGAGGDPVAAGALLDEALALARALGDRRLEGDCLRDLGLRHHMRGELDEAARIFTQSLEIAREVDNRHLEAWCHRVLGEGARQRGQLEAARDHLETALDTARLVGARDLEVGCAKTLGALHRTIGDLAAAADHSAMALDTARAMGQRRLEGSCARLAGNVALARGALDDAQALLESAYTLAREVANSHLEGWALRDLACLHLLEDRAAAARDCCCAGLALARHMGDRRLEASCLLELARVALRDDHHGEALDHARAAARGLRAHGDLTVAGRALIVLARAHRALGQPREARQALDDAQVRLCQAGAPIELALLSCARAELERDAGDARAADAALDEARRLAERLGVEPRSELGARLARAARA